jgi:hypothetical protein
LRLAFALVLVALVAGCGDDASKRFAERGNAICREARGKQAPAAGAYARLKALDPPAGRQAERDRFFADLAAMAKLVPATTSTDRSKAVAIANRLPDEARALGWTDCVG